MASLKVKESSKEGGLAKVQVRQVETNEEYSCQLEVDPSLVDSDGQVLKDVCFTFVQKAAESDDTLTEEQATKLHFAPGEDVAEDQSAPTESEDNKTPVVRIVERLLCYADDIEKKVREDEQIKKEFEMTVSECIVREEQGAEETDSGGRVTIDMKLVWSHIEEVFQLLLADLTAPNVDAITVLVRLGSGLGYCYYLIKQLVIRYLESITFKEVVDTLCNIFSLLFQHLLRIQFGKILQRLGGWSSLLATNMVDQGTRTVVNQATQYLPSEYLFLAIGVVSLGIALFLKLRK